ncbi:MAG: hypothetical protein CL955_03405 [Erythrobacteraceae bacterium]|nr:hypothetical protein [Erythrobacteraceae bacterium]
MGLGTFAAAPLMLLLVSGGLDRDTEKHFEKIADSVAMIGTCQQHDFTVDVAGIEDWKGRALDMAVAGGMNREDAQARLDQEIANELERVQEQFATAQRMAHSRDHVTRFNRSMKRDCERLAKDDLAGDYFSES